MKEDSKKYNKIRFEFYEKFHKKCEPILNGYKIKVHLLKLIFYIGIPLSVILALVFYILKMKEAFSFAVAFPAIFAFCYYMGSRNLKAEINGALMPAICSCLGNFKWIGARDWLKDNESFTIEKYDSIYLLPKYSDFVVENIFCGKYNNINLDIIEFNTSSFDKDGENFKGIIAKIPYNAFTSQIVIKHCKENKISLPQELRQIEIESIKYEKYNIYSNDEMESCILVNQDFIEALNTVSRAFKTNKKTACVFYKKNIYLALNTQRAFFEIIDSDKELSKKEEFYKTFEEILSLFMFIDHFKTDNEKIED